MFSTYKVQNLSSWTMLVFGVLALLLGAIGVVSPVTVLQLLGFEVVSQAARAPHDYTQVFMMASSMASFNMGVYYVLASLNNLKKFYAWTVPFRAVTFTVFSLSVLLGFAPAKFFGVALWELTGAIATGLALYYEHRKGIA